MKWKYLFLLFATSVGCQTKPAQVASCSPEREPANAGFLCEDIFSAKSGLRYHQYKLDSVLGFAQINPWLGRWQISDPKNLHLQTNDEAETLSLSGTVLNEASAPMAWLSLPEAFDVDYFVDVQARHREVPTKGDAILFKATAPGQSEGKGLRFHLEVDQADLQLEIYVSGNSLKIGDAFEAKAVMPLQAGPQSFTIPWQQFHLLGPVKADHENPNSDYATVPVEGQGRWAVQFPAGAAFVPSAFPIQQIGVRVVSAKGHEASPFHLKLNGPVYRDFDFQWIKQNMDAFAVAQVMRTMQGDGPRIMNMIMDKMSSQANQDYALSVIAQGPEAIKAALDPYHYKFVEFPGKVSTDEFFAHFEMGSNPVPLETPPFAYLHGRYTHAAQMLALLHESTPQEQWDIGRFLELMGRQGRTWRNLWNIFFDAPGIDGPQSPGWWVLKFREKHVLTEPAAQPI